MEIGANPREIQVKNKWKYMTDMEVQNKMLKTRSEHKFLYFDKINTTTAETFRSYGPYQAASTKFSL